MAEITASLVAKLRQMTQVGMMDCKQALLETGGDLDAAVDTLRKKGIAKADKKSARPTQEGVIAQHILPGNRVGVLVEVNCETDFVARNDDFRAFALEVARLFAENPQADVESLRAALVAKIGENIRVSRHQRLEAGEKARLAAYIHTGAKIGVLVEVSAGKDGTLEHEGFRQLMKDLTHQVTAANPTTVSREQVDAAVVAKEREIAAEQVKDKPPQAIEKIVQGKLDKFFQSICLLEQGFVKKNAEITVKEHLEAIARDLDDTLTLRGFVRFQVGETA